MSEISMGEIPTTKISQQDLERSIANVARKAEMERGKPLEKPEPTLTPAAGDEIRSADATTLKRLKNNALKIASEALRFSVDKVPLAATVASYLVSIGCGNQVENPNIHATNTPEPIPAAAALPKNTSHNTDILQPYTPQASIETPTLTPTPEPISTPSIPPPTETPTIPPSLTQEVTPTPPKPPQQEHAENKELIPFTPSITIIDAAPSVPTEGLIQKEFISNDEMIRNMLGDKYISKERIIQEFGQNYEEKWDEITEKYPQALLYKFADTYFTHGKRVAGVAEDTLERSGFKGAGFNILPLQKIFDKDSVKFIRDSSGNSGVSLNFDPKRIIELLKGDPNRVINGSFEVGNVELFQKTYKQLGLIREYDEHGNRLTLISSASDDGKAVYYYRGAVPEGSELDTVNGKYYDAEGKEVDPVTLEDFESGKVKNSELKVVKHTELSTVGAYAKEKAMENLPKLFEVCNAYPDKFFVFAGGNTGEDFREAMEILKDQVPKNFLVTAEYIEYDYGYGIYKGPSMSYGNYGPIYGPGIYVFNERSKHPHGSSFSVPELSMEIDILLSKGLSFEQAKEKILSSSDVYTASLIDKNADRLENGAEVTFRVFNPSKIQEK